MVYKEVRLYGFYKFLVLSIKMSPSTYIFTKNTLVIYKYVPGLCCFRVTATRKESLTWQAPYFTWFTVFASPSSGNMWSSQFCKCRWNRRLRIRPLTSRYVSESISATPLYCDVIGCQNSRQCPSNQKNKTTRLTKSSNAFNNAQQSVWPGYM